ncbi:MAG TPA: nitrogen regulation protein NR(II), partial [Chromatiales bacterium]|nr:nitrogen regulation protein NR(II) [Chromatiales bacterium]
NLNTAALLFDAERRLRCINTAGEMMFGISARQVVGQKMRELMQCPGDLVAGKLEGAAELGQPFTDRGVVLSLADGQQIVVDCTLTPIVDGEMPGGMLIELQQVDRHLRISKEEQLISQQEATRALVRGVAHEIKNPLGGLRGAAQLLERELDDETLTEYTQVIIEEADRLQQLVDRMLGPNKPPDKQPLNIHLVLERVCTLVAAESGDTLEIKRDYDPSIPEMVGDADQLIQAMLNLVRNAARAIDRDGEIVVRTRVARQLTIGNNRYRLVLVIEVEDSGPGIPPDLQQKIFYPMVSGSEGGSGLGLSIAQSLINSHQGLIEYRSKPGETVFTVLLPLEQNDER